MIQVLIAEDSTVARDLLTHIFNSQPDMEVIGAARNGADAIEAVKHLRPDIIVMDVNMPVLDGFEATRRIMETDPLPIVIVSASLDPQEITTIFRAVEAGALAFLEKPVGAGHPRYADLTQSLVQTVRLMSEVKVVRRRRFSPRPILAVAPAMEKPQRERRVGGHRSFHRRSPGYPDHPGSAGAQLSCAGSHRATYFPRFYPGVC